MPNYANDGPGMLRVHTDKALRISCLCFFFPTPNLNALSLIRLYRRLAATAAAAAEAVSMMNYPVQPKVCSYYTFYDSFFTFSPNVFQQTSSYVIFFFLSVFLSIHPLQPHPPSYFLFFFFCSGSRKCAHIVKKEGAGCLGQVLYGHEHLYFRVKKKKKHGDLFRLDDSIVLATAKPGRSDTSPKKCDVFFLLWGGGKERNKRKAKKEREKEETTVESVKIALHMERNSTDRSIVMSRQSTCGINLGIISAAVANDSTMPCREKVDLAPHSRMSIPYFALPLFLLFHSLRPRQSIRPSLGKN